MVRPGRRRPAPRRGAALLEFAVLLPLLLFLAVLAVDFGRIFHDDCVVANAARAGAVYAGASAATATDVAGITRVAQAAAADLDGAAVTVAVAAGTDSANGPCVDVTVSAHFQSSTAYLVPGTILLSHRARARVLPTTPNF